jgi:hypothetical protein
MHLGKLEVSCRDKRSSLLSKPVNCKMFLKNVLKSQFPLKLKFDAQLSFSLSVCPSVSLSMSVTMDACLSV